MSESCEISIGFVGYWCGGEVRARSLRSVETLTVCNVLIVVIHSIQCLRTLLKILVNRVLIINHVCLWLLFPSTHTQASSFNLSR